MAFCRYFKKGYFGVCTASESSHVPGIGEMERYCLKENFLCPIFELYVSRNIDVTHRVEQAGMSILSMNPSSK